jgi:hypothetical protein
MARKHDNDEFDMEEGLALALSYLENPSDVSCPRCGPGKVEVVCYLDARALEKEVIEPTEPKGAYTVILYCHGCSRAAALDLTRDEENDNETAENE